MRCASRPTSRSGICNTCGGEATTGLGGRTPAGGLSILAALSATLSCDPVFGDVAAADRKAPTATDAAMARPPGFGTRRR